MQELQSPNVKSKKGERFEERQLSDGGVQNKNLPHINSMKNLREGHAK